MKRIKRLSSVSLESFIPWLALTLLITLTYALFFQVPYAGIYFSSQGTLFQVYVTAHPDQALEVGDQLLQVGPITWANFTHDLRQPLFVGVQPGQVVPLVIERHGQRLNIAWTFPGPTLREIWARLNSEWPLSYFFWLAGTATLLFLRPKDERWWLLIAFNFLTALWLAVGGMLSPWHIWESALIFRLAVWLSVPVYWHLHWVFPAPLPRLSPYFWWAFYIIAISLALLDCFQLLPTGSYFLGFLLALAGSVMLLIAHFILQPMQRRDVWLLALAAMLVLTPSIAISIVGIFDAKRIAGIFTLFSQPFAFALLTFPILPFAYLYAATRRQLGGLEVRANRLIASYIFFIVLGTGMVVLITLADSWLTFPGKTVTIASLAALVVATLTSVGMAPFQRFVERRLLGISLPPLHSREKGAISWS